jgi:hypothetical protein
LDRESLELIEKERKENLMEEREKEKKEEAFDKSWL